MGLRDTLKQLVNTTITSSIGDLKSTAQFKTVTAGVYDPDTGLLPQTVVTYTCQCFVGTVTQDDVNQVGMVSTGHSVYVADLGALSTMRKILIPTVQLEGVEVDALDDEVVVDGVFYTVKQAKLDPSGALFTFLVVAKSGMKLGGN